MRNFSKITVIINNNFIGVFFRNCLNQKFIKIPMHPDEKVSEIIERYRRTTLDYNKDVKFIFNAKELNPDLANYEAGITEDSHIFIVSTKEKSPSSRVLQIINKFVPTVFFMEQCI